MRLTLLLLFESRLLLIDVITVHLPRKKKLSTVKPFCGPTPTHEICYISSHTTIKQQIQCLATKVSTLSMKDGKTIHPSRVIEESNATGAKLRPKKPQNQPCLVNRLSAVSISEKSVRQQLRRRPSSAVEVVSTDEHFNSQMKHYSIEQKISSKVKLRPASAVDEVSTASPLNNQLTKTYVLKNSTHLRKCSLSTVNGVSSELTLNNQLKDQTERKICTQPKRRGASAENIVSSDQILSKKLKDCTGGKISSQVKRRPASAVDVGSTSPTVNNQLTQSCGRRSNSQLIRNDQCPASKDDVQLLHPDWRKVPWRPYFGWTDGHEDLCKHLQSQVRRRVLCSIYYASAEGHCAAGLTWRYRHGGSLFLGGPSVSSASEALDVIRRVFCHDVTSQLMDVGGPGYDGDDEDDVI